MREALKLALEALDYAGYLTEPESDLGCNCLICQATAAVKEALAQPEQELLAWKNAALRVGEDLSSIGPNGYYNMTAQQWLDWAMAQQPRGNNSLAQTEQEPVGINGLTESETNATASVIGLVNTTPYVATPLPTQPDLDAICQDLQEMTYNQAMRIAELEDKLKLALNALESLFNWKSDPERGQRCAEALTAIKEVLKIKDKL